MKVYMELVFLDNFFIDWLLLRTTMRLLPGTRRSKKWVWAAAAVGGVYAMLAPLAAAMLLRNVVVKAGVGILLVWIAGGIDTMASFSKRIAVFYGLSVLLGGLILALGNIMGYGNSLLNGAIATQFPLWVVLSFAVAISLGYERIARSVKKHLCMHHHTTELELTIKGKTARMPALIDTGNMLDEPISGLPVIACHSELYQKYFGALPLNDAICIPIETVSGVGQVYAIKPDSAYIIGNKARKIIALVGVAPFGNAQAALLPPVLI